MRRKFLKHYFLMHRPHYLHNVGNVINACTKVLKECSFGAEAKRKQLLRTYQQTPGSPQPLPLKENRKRK
jgi:hypothetical protein